MGKIIMKLTVWNKGKTKRITLKKGDYIETRPLLVSARRNEWKEGIKGYIAKPIKRFDKYIWIAPVNDAFLYELSLEGTYTGILKNKITAVNGKEVVDEHVEDRLPYIIKY